MALIDPPKGVWLAPWLIYEVDDLERETYRALLQMVGWLWVTKKTGGALRTTVAELGARWGIGERAVYKRLALYRERGYLQVEMEGGRVRVRLGQTPNTKTNTTTNEENNEGRERRVHEGDEDPGSRERRVHGHERSVHEIGADPGVNNTGGGVVSVFGEQPPPQTNPIIHAALLDLGVRPAAAAELALDPWVTLARIERWAEVLGADQNVRSVPAVLYVNLRQHWEPPVVDEAQDRRRYIRGEYAEFVEH